MPRQQNRLIVIADGEHVRFVRPAIDNALHSDTAFDSISAHLRSADLGSDHPGVAPRHDPHAMEKVKFAHEIAKQLNAAPADGFAELVVVAPSHVLNDILATLNPATEAKVIGTVAKDLVKTPDNELWPHLKAWVRPVDRSVSQV